MKLSKKLTEHINSIPKQFKDFRNFLYYCWKFLGLREPTPSQYEIAYTLQHGSKREIILAFRGIGKSWITSAFVVWKLLWQPWLNILVVSASKDRSDDFSTFTLRLIREIPLLRSLIPDGEDRSSKVAFDVALAPASHAPSVKSKGITSQITGSRADLIIADDVEVPNNSETQMMREKLSEKIKEFAAIIKPRDESQIIFLGTPQCEDSIYTKLPDRGYNVTVWPSEYPAVKELDTLYENNVSIKISDAVRENPSLEGRPTDPKRFNVDELEEAKLEYGRSGYALQFLLNPRLSDQDRYPLKLNDLIVMDVDKEIGPEKVIYGANKSLELTNLPNVGMKGDRYYSPFDTVGTFVPYRGRAMAIDPSGRGRDETGVAVGYMLNSQIFIPECCGLKGGYSDQTLREIAEIAREYKVNKIVIESNMGDGMFMELLKPVLRTIYPCSIEEVRHSVQKEKRIVDTLEPVISNHRLIFDPRVIEKDYASIKSYPAERQILYSLFYQLSRITKQRGALVQDDRIDVLSILVNFFTEQMAQHRDKKIKEREGRDMDKELQNFMNSTLHFGKQAPRQQGILTL